MHCFKNGFRFGSDVADESEELADTEDRDWKADSVRIWIRFGVDQRPDRIRRIRNWIWIKASRIVGAGGGRGSNYAASIRMPCAWKGCALTLLQRVTDMVDVVARVMGMQKGVVLVVLVVVIVLVVIVVVVVVVVLVVVVVVAERQRRPRRRRRPLVQQPGGHRRHRRRGGSALSLPATVMQHQVVVGERHRFRLLLRHCVRPYASTPGTQPLRSPRS